MRKLPNSRWIKHHAIAVYERGNIGGSDGLVAVVDREEAGIVGFSCDSYYGFELGVDCTKMPDPKHLFDIPDYGNPFDYISRSDYVDHPSVKNFKHEIAWLWEGTADELYYAAKNNTDLMFPDRKICEQDSDYLEMSELYSEIRKYLRKKNRKEKK